MGNVFSTQNISFDVQQHFSTLGYGYYMRMPKKFVEDYRDWMVTQKLDRDDENVWDFRDKKTCRYH